MTGDDDDPGDEWKRRPSLDDTAVDLDPSDLRELEADAVTPTCGPEALPGYELGRHQGAAAVLHAVRDHLLGDGASPDWADEIVRSLAERAGVKLG